MTPSEVGSIPPQLAVVGSLNRDLVLNVAGLPGPGDTVVGVGRAWSSLGGKGANQAAAAAAYLDRPGAVAMVGCVGDDPAGHEMLHDLRERGVDVGATQTTPGPSGAAVIAVDPEGENLILVDPGANAALRTEDVRIPVVANAEVVLLQLEIPVEVVGAAIGHARGRVILNPAPAGGAARFVRSVDVLVPNLTELASLVGAAPATGYVDTLQQARQLSARPDVVVTMGPQGALVLRTDGRSEMVEGVEVAVRDTTGAGDCFCGVLAGMLIDGFDLVDSVRSAVAASALSVTAAGARGKLPNRLEIEGVGPQ